MEVLKNVNNISCSPSPVFFNDFLLKNNLEIRIRQIPSSSSYVNSQTTNISFRYVLNIYFAMNLMHVILNLVETSQLN